MAEAAEEVRGRSPTTTPARRSGLCRRHRQHRPVLRRGHLPGHRLDPADQVGFLEQSGIFVEPLHLSVWAIPTAIAPSPSTAVRLVLFDRGWPRWRLEAERPHDRPAARLPAGRPDVRRHRRMSARDRGQPKRWKNAAVLGPAGLQSSCSATTCRTSATVGLVLVMALIAGTGGLGRGAPKTTSRARARAAAPSGSAKLFIPALVIPAVALTGSLGVQDPDAPWRATWSIPSRRPWSRWLARSVARRSMPRCCAPAGRAGAGGRGG
jgi:hypothetical protein